MSLLPLGIAKEVVEAVDLEISYAYDDLVFVEHNPFLLQYDERSPKSFNLFFNRECDEVHAANLEKRLIGAAADREFALENCGSYALSESAEGDKEVQLQFFPSAT